MGTSKSLGTPSGGRWTPVKNAVTGALAGSDGSSAAKVAGSVVAALNGLRGMTAGTGRSAGDRSGGGGAGGGGGGRRGGGGGGGGGFRSTAASAAGTVGGFGGLVQASGLDAALEALNLVELQGQPAIDVVSRIADHIAETADGLDSELFRGALVECVFEAAEISGDSSYDDLEASLQSYLEREGAAGLAEAFLTRVTFSKIWMLIENHANCRADSNSSADSLMVGVERVCARCIAEKFDEVRNAGRFDSLDWFGQDGQRVVNEIVRDVASRLEANSEGDAE